MKFGRGSKGLIGVCVRGGIRGGMRGCMRAHRSVAAASIGQSLNVWEGITRHHDGGYVCTQEGLVFLA